MQEKILFKKIVMKKFKIYLIEKISKGLATGATVQNFTIYLIIPL